MKNTSTLVALEGCESYSFESVSDVIERITDAAQFNDKYHGKTVLLKPNLISSTASALACTHPNIIAAVASWFKNRGARVIVGDSPAFGSATKVCKKLGIDDVLKTIDIPVVDFDTFEKRVLPGGVVLPIARQVLECDLFVGLPKIKAHNQMYVTLSLKNNFGIVTGTNKARLHMVHGSSHKQFAEILFELLTVLPPHLHIADGVDVMHRSGPLDGECLKLNCIAASSSPVALDTAVIEALDLEADRSPLWQVAHSRGDSEAKLEHLEFPLKNPADFQGSGFVAPEELNGIRFNPFRFLKGLARRGLMRFSH